MTNGPDRYDWTSANTDIVLVEQPTTAIYRNGSGSVVIRQEGAWDADDDPYVILAPQNLRALIRALEREAQADDADRPAPLALPPPRDATGAERQRRFRETHRNGNGVTHNGVTAPLFDGGAEAATAR